METYDLFTRPEDQICIVSPKIDLLLGAYHALITSSTQVLYHFENLGDGLLVFVALRSGIHHGLQQ